MFIKPRPIVRELNNKEVLQCFLKNFHLRQSKCLAKIPKILLSDSWFSKKSLFVSFDHSIDRVVPVSQFEHEIIIPIVDAMLLRLERLITDCDGIVFYNLTIPEYTNSCVQSLAGVAARIVSVNDFGAYPGVVTRIDISFTPMWLEKTAENCLYYIGGE